MRVTCSNCGGTGWSRWGGRCGICDGRGAVEEDCLAIPPEERKELCEECGWWDGQSCGREKELDRLMFSSLSRLRREVG